MVRLKAKMTMTEPRSDCWRDVIRERIL
jgi:hypothetical protein